MMIRSNHKLHRRRQLKSFEQLEDRIALSVNGISSFEQLMVELINRSRANPTVEANLHEVALNAGLNPGTITTAAKAPLAAEQILTDTAGDYSDWMLNADFFSHTDPNGDLPWDRTELNGYPIWAGVGENIAWGTFFSDREAAVHARHHSLFLSPDHRENMLDPDWNEIGIGITYGTSPYQSVSTPDFDLSIVTENFGGRSNLTYLTGVAFSDSDLDNFYGIGEGLSNVSVTATNGPETFTTTTAAAGGYSLLLSPGTYTITAAGNGVDVTFADVNIGSSNVKIDFEPTSTANDPNPASSIGETGVLIGNSANKNDWHTVSLQRNYDDPIVIVGPPSKNNGAPTVVRVRQVTSDSFQYRVDEWDYLDDVHPNERIGYMVVEAGEHQLPGGQRLVAGKVRANHQFTGVSLDGFNTAPNVITSINSHIGGSTVTPRVRNVTSTRFQVQVQEEEQADNRHARETVAYIAFDSGTGESGDLTYVAGNTGQLVDHRVTPISLGSQFSGSPVFLAGTSSTFGGDPAALRLNELTPSRAMVFVQEEKSANAEVNHAREIVSYLAIEPGFLVAGNPSSTNASPTIDNQTFNITTTATVVGSVQASDPDGDTLTYSITAGDAGGTFTIDGTGQITVADSTLLASTNQFNLTVEVTDPQSASSSATVTVNVTSSSTSDIGEIGTTTAQQNSASQWYTITLNRTYNDPVVVMGPLSYAGVSPAVVRVRNVTNNSFEWQIDEWDYLDGRHGAETVSYMVVEAGNHTLSDGTRIAAGQTSVDHRFSPVGLPGLNGTPVVLTTVASHVGASAVTPRLRNVSGSGFEVRLHEEQNNDPRHALESVNYVALEAGSGQTEGTPFIVDNANVSHMTANVSFDSPVGSTPALFAGIQSYVGGDTTALRYRSLDATGFSVFLQEERSQDQEVNHAIETVGYLAIPTGILSTSSSGGSAGIRRSEFAANRRVSDTSTDDRRRDHVDIGFALLTSARSEWLNDVPYDRKDVDETRTDRSHVKLSSNIHDMALSDLDF